MIIIKCELTFFSHLILSMKCKINKKVFDKMSFEECELAILRNAIDTAENIEGKKLLNNPQITRIIEIVESFLKKKKRICYGGTAINNILPNEVQFYNKEIEFPDYDFFSPTPLKDAKSLADIYYKKGFQEVEAKAGTHAGTFKVFVNFIPVADITFMEPKLYKSLMKKAILVDDIYYSPPNYLRMLMYLELSRPAGNISRWEKVLKRIILLNKQFPLKGTNCNLLSIQRIIDPQSSLTKQDQHDIFDITRDSFIDEGLIFFGAMANEMYVEFDSENSKHDLLPKIPDFDVLSLDPYESAIALKHRLEEKGFKKIKIKKQKGVGDIIADHYEIKVKDETIAFIYEPLACHSFNIINIKGREIKIATIDTMLSFYLAFLYVDKEYYDYNRIICMSEILFRVQQENRLEQKGILKRFSVNCFGKQLTLGDIREEKANKFRELKKKRGSDDWNWYFYKYSPADKHISTKKYKCTRNTRNKSKKNKKTRKRHKIPFSELPKVFGF